MSLSVTSTPCPIDASSDDRSKNTRKRRNRAKPLSLFRFFASFQRVSCALYLLQRQFQSKDSDIEVERKRKEAICIQPVRKRPRESSAATHEIFRENFSSKQRRLYSMPKKPRYIQHLSSEAVLVSCALGKFK